MNFEERKKEIARKNGEVLKNAPDGEPVPVRAVVHKDGLIELVPVNLSK